MKRTLGVITALAAAMVSAQAPPRTPDSSEMTARDAPATFTTKVNLVMVPVVVRDRKGHAIGNLSQQDFQLFDQGKPQLISRFAVERSDTPPVTAPLATNEAPANEAAPNQTAPPATAVIADRFVLYLIDDIYMEPGDLLRVKLATQKHLEELTPGTRAAIYTTSGEVSLDFTADQAKLQQTLSQIQRPIGAVPGPTGPLAAGSTALELVWRRLEDLTRRLSRMPGSRNLVFVSPGYTVPDMDRGVESALFDQAIRSNVIINTLQGRGLYTIIPGGRADGTPGPTTTAIDDVLAELANNTGGTFFHNDNGLKEGLDRLANRPEYIYVLGFSPQNLRYDGSHHSLKVTLKPKDYDVQARLGYYAPLHGADPAETAKEEIREAVFSLEEASDFPVDLHTQFFKVSDSSARLTVVAHLDMSNLRFQKSEDRNKNIVTMVSGIFDRDGHYVRGVQRVIDMKLRDETLATVQSSGITVRTNFDVGPGTYTIRIVVRDAEGQQMAARNGVAQIP